MMRHLNLDAIKTDPNSPIVGDILGDSAASSVARPSAPARIRPELRIQIAIERAFYLEDLLQHCAKDDRQSIEYLLRHEAIDIIEARKEILQAQHLLEMADLDAQIETIRKLN